MTKLKTRRRNLWEMKHRLCTLLVVLLVQLDTAGQTHTTTQGPAQIKFHGEIVTTLGSSITDGKAVIHITSSSVPVGCIQDILNMKVGTDSMGTFSTSVPMVSKEIYYTVHHPNYLVAGGVIIVYTASVHYVRMPLHRKK